ncbi:hypothetical protein [Blastococcus sp. SYSU D00813]
MSTQHDQHAPVRTAVSAAARPLRCLRHRVWMAACDDCRDAHRDRSTAAPRPSATVA